MCLKDNNGTMTMSIFGPKLKILKENTDNMKVVVQCPNCRTSNAIWAYENV